MDKKLPKVWLVVGNKLGDNAQVERIAKALQWPFEWKTIHFKSRYDKGKPRFKPSLYHVDLSKTDDLSPPWPDLVITVGRRPAMVAAWIKAQSGGHAKIVLLGRPKRYWAPYDLVLAPAQYALPQHPKAFSFGLPLMYPPQEKIAEAVEYWEKRFSGFPRPLVAVLIGGVTQPYRLDREVLHDILEKSRALAGTGTLYVCTSRRTPAEVSKALAEIDDPDLRVFRWGTDEDNPYFALLGLADAFVVTGDSISMMVEVARLQKPLAIYPLPVRFPLLHRLVVHLSKLLLYRSPDASVIGRVGMALLSTGLIGYLRDLERIHRWLYEHGAAVPLGQGEIFSVPQGELTDDLPKVVSRIKGLFEG
ncbi:MAG: hypothetical protein AXA67_04435 [Methylothermaceae bacteria B42]|nr:MAG: hypothetical protein AXA67_04435 [Methylothermaceae bacteria B42]HHJ39935.1 hypothetical protein [Methylothermaceae bacterium]